MRWVDPCSAPANGGAESTRHHFQRSPDGTIRRPAAFHWTGAGFDAADLRIKSSNLSHQTTEKGMSVDTLLWIVIIAAIVVAALYYLRQRGATAASSLQDAQAEARRWVERLGGQVYVLDPKDDPAAGQALSDAAERFTAAGSQVEQAKSVQQYRLAQQTAYEGLYYVRAARTSLGLDPGPELPAIPGQQQAGVVSEDRSVTVEGHDYEASPQPGTRTQHYYPGGMVAGRPVPQGWYSEPWWRPALVAGAWGVGTYLVASTLFSGMALGGGGYDAGYDAGMADAGDAGGGDFSGDAGGGFDGGGFDGGGFDGGF